MNLNNFNWVGFENGKVAFNPASMEYAEGFLNECAKRGLNPPEGLTHTNLTFFWHKYGNYTWYVYTGGHLTFMEGAKGNNTKEGLKEIHTYGITHN